MLLQLTILDSNACAPVTTLYTLMCVFATHCLGLGAPVRKHIRFDICAPWRHKLDVCAPANSQIWCVCPCKLHRALRHGSRFYHTETLRGTDAMDKNRPLKRAMGWARGESDGGSWRKRRRGSETVCLPENERRFDDGLKSSVIPCRMNVK